MSWCHSLGCCPWRSRPPSCCSWPDAALELIGLLHRRRLRSTREMTAIFRMPFDHHGLSRKQQHLLATGRRMKCNRWSRTWAQTASKDRPGTKSRSGCQRISATFWSCCPTCCPGTRRTRSGPPSRSHLQRQCNQLYRTSQWSACPRTFNEPSDRGSVGRGTLVAHANALEHGASSQGARDGAAEGLEVTHLLLDSADSASD